MTDITVLLIEDNRDDEWIALWALKKVGITQVTVARDGSEALSRLFAGQDQAAATLLPDIIFLDLRLPKVDGLEVLRRIREDGQAMHLSVAVLTSSEDPHDKDTCDRLGVSAFISKPLEKESILKLLQEVAPGRC